MISDDQTSPAVSLDDMPSAQAGVASDLLPDAKPLRRRRSIVGFLAKSFLLLALLCVVGLGVIYYLIASGPVSNEKLKAAVESQLTNLLGEGRAAQLGDISFTLGKSGLIAVDARDIRLTENDKTNLGIASQAAVSLKAWPLVTGQFVAKKIAVTGASVALPIETEAPSGAVTQKAALKPWPKQRDFSQPFKQLGELFYNLEEAIERSGLEELDLQNTKLIGFDQLGLVSKTARLIDLRLEKDINFQKGLFFTALIETDISNWRLKGSWTTESDGGRLLNATFSGLNTREFFTRGDTGYLYIENPIEVRARLSFAPDRQLKDPSFSLALEGGRLKMGKHHDSRISGAQLNFRLFVDKNQIELEPSPLVFPRARAVLTGGLRYPKAGKRGALTEEDRPIFEILANDVVAWSMSETDEAAEASLIFSGHFRPDTRQAVADKIALYTADGTLSGDGALTFDGETPSLKLDLSLPEIRVSTFKQLWPPFFAGGAHKWAREGITDGIIRKAWVKADIPPGIVGRIDEGAKIPKDSLVAEIPISKASVKSFGSVPNIADASGTIRHNGMETTVTLADGNVPVGKNASVKLKNGKLEFGDFELEPIPAKLSLDLAGRASSIVSLGTYEPITYSNQLKLKASDVSGSVASKINATFDLKKGGDVSNVDWKGNLKLKDFSSRKPIQGRKLSNADLTIDVSPREARIKGEADVDGVRATLAMIEPLDGRKRASKSAATLTVDDKDRKKLGFDTSAFLTGPVAVTISTNSDGSSHFDVDLKKAELELPWIHWRKGKGISATASFDLSSKGGVQTLRNFKLRGKGFGAIGTLKVDKAGLIFADLKKVKLNKVDDFDVVAKRIKGGMDIKVSARSYDGRAIIRTFLENDASDPAARNKQLIKISAKVGRLYGFKGQNVSGLNLDYVQSKGKVVSADARGVSTSGGRVVFTMKPQAGKIATKMTAQNAGDMLKFLDIYSKVEGGGLEVNLIEIGGGDSAGTIAAGDFFLLNEPRVGELLKPAAEVSQNMDREGEIVRKKPKSDPRRVKVKWLTAEVRIGNKSLSVRRGRLRGGDAGATFEGLVYNARNRTDMTGTYLPAYGLNKAVSKIPIFGKVFGDGRKRGLIGITFKLRGRFNNPELVVNPVSLIAPGVFRKLFEF